MDGLSSTLRGIVRAAAPIVIAGQGELITERSGIINLSLDGSIMLSAMTAHAVVRNTGSLTQAVLAAMAVGAAIAFIVVFSSIALRLNQVAVGFILTVLCADLAIFLGKPHYNRPGKEMPYAPIPILKDIPLLGPVFFQHNILIYFSLALVLVVWFYIYRTRPGLTLRSVGEHPEAAFVRGTRVQFWRYFYTLVGGSLVGIAGATYSLSVKLGWKQDSARRRLDRPGDCHLRPVDALARGARRVSDRRPALAGNRLARQRCDRRTLADRQYAALVPDDPDSDRGDERRSGKIGSLHAGTSAAYGAPLYAGCAAARAGQIVPEVVAIDNIAAHHSMIQRAGRMHQPFYLCKRNYRPTFERGKLGPQSLVHYGR